MLPLLCMCFLIEGEFTDLGRIFLENDRPAFQGLLEGDGRIKTDLRPLLYDRGDLSGGQVALSFEKLQRRFRIVEANVVNSQADTNYAWVEISLELLLENTRDGTRQNVVLAFQFKVTDADLTMTRWILQDIQ